MSRADTTPIDLLHWVLQRLRSELALTSSTCFLAADDLAPAQLPPAAVFLTVTPLEGAFRVPEQTVGNAYEDWAFRVRIYLRLARDRPGADESRLVHPADGILAWKRKVLRALCGQDIATANIGGTLAATASTRLVWLRTQKQEVEYASLAIDFTLPLGWDLT